MDIQRQAFQEWYIANHHDGDIHPNQQLLEWSEKGGFYFASSVEDLWEAWQAAKAQAVPDTYTPIVLALEDVQSKIAKTSFLTMDEENENEVMAVNANELAAYIDELIEAQEPTND